jgi:hypothetical protein
MFIWFGVVLGFFGWSIALNALLQKPAPALSCEISAVGNVLPNSQIEATLTRGNAVIFAEQLEDGVKKYRQLTSFGKGKCVAGLCHVLEPYIGRAVTVGYCDDTLVYIGIPSKVLFTTNNSTLKFNAEQRKGGAFALIYCMLGSIGLGLTILGYRKLHILWRTKQN